jgi:pyruvate dehydrogenase (quinone)
VSKNVSDVLWEILYSAGVRRCYGIVGDALNPVVDALRRQGKIELIHVHHEEWGGFAAVADAYLTGAPVAICGTSGPGVAHLVNAMLDARKEGAPIIAIAGDVETYRMDTDSVEELNPYLFFGTSSLYTARIVNPEQIRPIVHTALRTALAQRGPTLIALPGDIAMKPAPEVVDHLVVANAPVSRPSDADLGELAKLINAAERVTIFGGDGCRDAHDLVVALAAKTMAPVGYAFRGKQYLEYDNPFAVGMTGLIGFGGAYRAMHEADLLLMLGTDFPFSNFIPGPDVKKVQLDREATHLGRRTPLDLGLVGDVADTISALLPLIVAKQDDSHLQRAKTLTREWHDSLQHYVTKGPTMSPIRPEYLVATLDRVAADDAFFSVDTGTACIWAARYLQASRGRRIFGSFSWASMANAAPNAAGAQFAFPGRQTIALCGDGGFSMLGLGDVLTLVERKLPVTIIVLNNSSFDFVRIEQQEAGIIPFGTEFKSANFAAIAEAMGAKGLRLEEPAKVEDVLREALAYRSGPVVVDAVVDPFALSIPSHVPLETAKGFTLSAWHQFISGHSEILVGEIKHNLGLANSPFPL